MRRKQQWQKELLQSAESLEAADVLSVKKQLKKLGIGYYDKDIIGQIAGQSGVITGVYQGKFELLRIFGSHTDKFHVYRTA